MFTTQTVWLKHKFGITPARLLETKDSNNKVKVMLSATQVELEVDKTIVENVRFKLKQLQ